MEAELNKFERKELDMIRFIYERGRRKDAFASLTNFLAKAQGHSEEKLERCERAVRIQFPDYPVSKA